MPDSTPKPFSQRRRRNSVAGVANLPASGRKGPIPAPETDIALSPRAKKYWNTLWASPMAMVYTDADVFPLTRLAILIHERETGASVWNADGEIRQLEDRFGVSPLARRRLNWEIDQAEQAQRPATPAGASVSARLHSVS